MSNPLTYNKIKYVCSCGEGFKQKVNYNKHIKKCEAKQELLKSFTIKKGGKYVGDSI